MENNTTSNPWTNQELQPVPSQQRAKENIDYALLAQKSQLRLEQKWIEEALAKLKQQWNSLQIERLQLESNLASLRCGTAAPSHHPTPAIISETVETQNIMPSNLDTVVNCESLNLEVPGYSCNNDTLNDFAMMEEEEEEDDDYEDVNLDMCMFMTQQNDNDK